MIRLETLRPDLRVTAASLLDVLVGFGPALQYGLT